MTLEEKIKYCEIILNYFPDLLRDKFNALNLHMSHYNIWEEFRGRNKLITTDTLKNFNILWKNLFSKLTSLEINMIANFWVSNRDEILNAYQKLKELN